MREETATTVRDLVYSINLYPWGEAIPANPFVSLVIPEIYGTALFEDIWMRNFWRPGPAYNATLWIYFGSLNGVYRQYPGGTISDRSFDPRERPLYLSAVTNAGELSVTAPYLDCCGAGYVRAFALLLLMFVCGTDIDCC
jgi:hypothetical protein